MLYFCMHYAIGLTQGVSAKIRGDEEMDDGGPTAGIFYFVFLIIVDLFFYGFGAAIHALNSKEVERKATEEKNGKNFESKEYCCWFVLFDVIAGIYNYSKCRNTVCSYYSVSTM